MRFKSFLESVERTPQEQAQLIYDHCQPFLRASGWSYPNGDFLYRGMGRIEPEPFIEVPVRPREPKDSTKQIHALLDNQFAEDYGVRFRSKGIFCTGAQGIASDYGTVYMIFPIGKFDFLWSPLVDDAFNHFDGWKFGTDPIALQNQRHLFNARHIWGTEDEKEVFKTYLTQLQVALADNAFDYRFNEDLPGAIASDHEIMLSCHSYYAVYWDIPPQWNRVVGGESRAILDALRNLMNA